MYWTWIKYFIIVAFSSGNILTNITNNFSFPFSFQNAHYGCREITWSLFSRFWCTFEGNPTSWSAIFLLTLLFFLRKKHYILFFPQKSICFRRILLTLFTYRIPWTSFSYFRTPRGTFEIRSLSWFLLCLLWRHLYSLSDYSYAT